MAGDWAATSCATTSCAMPEKAMKESAMPWSGRHPGADRGHAGHEAEGNGADEDGRDVAATREEFASSVWRLPV